MRPKSIEEVPKIGQFVHVGDEGKRLPVRTIDAAGLPVVGGEERLGDEQNYRERIALLGKKFHQYAQIDDEFGVDMGGIGANVPKRWVA